MNSYIHLLEDLGVRKIEILNEVRRRFTDIKFGYSLIGPIIVYANFSLIAYNFTDLKEWIPFGIFVVFFAIGLATVLAFAGLVFRKYQLPTDFRLQYERNVEFVKSQLAILEGIREILDTESVHSQRKENTKIVTDRIDYLRRVVKAQIKYDQRKSI